MGRPDDSEEMYPVERGVPIPAPFKRVVRVGMQKYPWAEMEVGDSFFVPHTPEEPGTWVQNRVNASAVHWLKRYARSHRFTTRQLANGVRCWRTA